MQNRTIEERVAILEFQVDNMNDDLSDFEQHLIVVEDEQEDHGQEIAELQMETDGKCLKLIHTKRQAVASTSVSKL